MWAGMRNKSFAINSLALSLLSVGNCLFRYMRHTVRMFVMRAGIADSVEQINCSSCLKYHLSHIDYVSVNDLLVNAIHISQYSFYQKRVT